MKSHFKIILPLLIVFTFSCKKNKYTVETDFTTTGEIVEKISVSGKIQPEKEVKISSDVSGEIIELLVEEGDSVKKGQLLLRIKPDNYKSMLDMAQAAVNSSQAALAQAKSRHAQSKANFIKTKMEFERNKKLFEQKVISQSDFEALEAQYKVGEQEVEAAFQSIKSAEFNIQSNLAQLNDAKQNLNKTTIYAPASGILSKLNVEQGERVVGTSQMAGTELLRIADLENMEVSVAVNENDIVRIRKGDKVIIEVDSYEEDKFEGSVTAVASTANDALSMEAVTEFEVRIKILPSSYKLLKEKYNLKYPFKPGMTASVDIITDVKKDIIKAPLSAVTTREDDGKTKEVVFVLENEKVKLQEVKTGISDFDYIEIKDGLKDSLELIVGPYNYVSTLLKDGDTVRKKEKEDEKEVEK